MKRDNGLLIAAVALAAALLWPRRSNAATNPSGEVVSWSDPDAWWPAPVAEDQSWIGAGSDGFWGAFDDYSGGYMGSGNGDGLAPLSTPDYVGAFLYMIQAAETSPSLVASGDAYHTLYGGNMFGSLADHPANLGWRGVTLPDSMCAAAGYGPGCVSTAAGAYQIIKPTWNRVRRKAAIWGDYLPDFSPASQDEAARRLLIECGALPLIQRGDFDGALRKASSLWASLPGSTARQSPKTRNQVFAYYSSALGVA